MKNNITIIGLGYVGLPVAVAFAEKFPGTIGFDIDERRATPLRKNAGLAAMLRKGHLCRHQIGG